jgi:hypothetical protein
LSVEKVSLAWNMGLSTAVRTRADGLDWRMSDCSATFQRYKRAKEMVDATKLKSLTKEAQQVDHQLPKDMTV